MSANDVQPNPFPLRRDVRLHGAPSVSYLPGGYNDMASSSVIVLLELLPMNLLFPSNSNTNMSYPSLLGFCGQFKSIEKLKVSPQPCWYPI